ncbi:FAD-dependent oxidoreductase [Paenibacillus sp. LHD-117]|uniref:FAD-dependent oxidoreductase n=1 Tax=Paenibacillus sp. LHD-117 TaxID=3071412 RepID=UPI0027DFF3E6|nr:FAD-dependent oxidoreductase [Paenibacillus sp. LHD-117]MDQ6419980.1 FAD-dependent oxidoreductase [Paenibacillus sp. LHD-117]
MAQRKRRLAAAAILLLVVIAGSASIWRTAREEVNGHTEASGLSFKSAKDRYDVIVAGTDPEGVAAAISAARNGLRVLLVDGKGRDRLGGLLTMGWLNSLDLNLAPGQPEGAKAKDEHDFLNKGIFQEWYDQLDGTSIDVDAAADVFLKMVKAEKNVSLLLGVKTMEPMMHGAAVAGLIVTDERGDRRVLHARAVIDATQDADIAAMAGVPYTIGREDLGNPEARMAVTLVFKLSGLTQEMWDSFGKRKDTGADQKSAWGFLAASDYPSSDPDKVALRGLNIGRQNDGTILVNAMHIFGVDPLDPASVQEGLRIGREEAPRIVDYLKYTFKEMKELTYAGTAPELYIRESRHIQGEYRLAMADLMENRDSWDAIAYGSYDVDIQRLGRDDTGAIMMSPMQYAVPFRTLVPKKADNLLVVGRTASFDSLPHGSARVIPLGMATGEAAGAAAKLVMEEGMTFRELAASKSGIAKLQERLGKQGMDLRMRDLELPAYRKHKAYRGLLAAVSMGMTLGGYDNKRWDLDGLSTRDRYLTMMQRLAKMHGTRFHGQPDHALGSYHRSQAPVRLEDAAYALLLTAGIQVKPANAVAELKSRGWISPETWANISHPGGLTNGETYMLVRDAVERHAGITYE